MCSVVHSSVGEFRSAVVVESGRLSALCDTWRQVTNKDAEAPPEQKLPEDVLGDINVAIGQAELLKKERFTQFGGLIDNCEFELGEMKTTIQDLQGFWDIVYFQVDDIIQKFAKLSKLKSNNWQQEEPQPAPVVKTSRPVALKKAVGSSSSAAAARKPRPGGGGASALRAHILAARNKMTKLTLNEDAPVAAPAPSAAAVPTPAAAPAPSAAVLTPAAASNVSIPDTIKVVLHPCSPAKSDNNITNSTRAPPTVTAATATHKKTPTKPVRKHKSNKENTDDRNNSTNISKSIRANSKLVSESGDGAERTVTSEQSCPASPPAQCKTSPNLSTFDAGFFKVETPSKSKMARKAVSATTPQRNLTDNGPDGLVLSSSLLKQRVKHTPVNHKDYSPCMRITRSMKIHMHPISRLADCQKDELADDL